MNTQRADLIPFPQRLWSRKARRMERAALTARAIADASWRIVDALDDLPIEAQEIAVRQALEILDAAQGLEKTE